MTYILWCQVYLLCHWTIMDPALIDRVPTQSSFSNSLCFPCFFPVWLQIFAVICDYYIHLTDLADISSFKKDLGIFAADIFTFRIREFTTWANKIPCVFPVFWQNFQIPRVFPDREYFWPFSLFCLCSGHPELGIKQISAESPYHHLLWSAGTTKGLFVTRIPMAVWRKLLYLEHVYIISWEKLHKGTLPRTTSVKSDFPLVMNLILFPTGAVPSFNIVTITYKFSRWTS